MGQALLPSEAGIQPERAIWKHSSSLTRSGQGSPTRAAASQRVPAGAWGLLL